MATTSILELPIIAEGQSQKIAGINTCIGEIEKEFGAISIAKTTTPQVLADTSARYGHITITGTLTANHVIEIGATLDHSFIVVNGTSGAYTLEVKATGTSLLIKIPQGCSVPIRRGASGLIVDERHNLLRPRTAVRLANNQTLNNATLTRVDFDTVVSDPSSSWDSTNKRFNALVSGLYHIHARIALSGLAGNPGAFASLRVNGTEVWKGDRLKGVAYTDAGLLVSGDLLLSAGDYVDIAARQDGGAGAQIDLGAAETYAVFECVRYS